MINNGDKKLPLDRYPFMENELKKYDTPQDDIKKLQDDVKKLQDDVKKLQDDEEVINETLSMMTDNLILVNNTIEDLTEVVEYKDFFTIADSVVSFMAVTYSKAFKVGNAIQVYIRLRLYNPPQTWTGSTVGSFDYNIIPKPINLFGVIDQRFIGQVSSVSGDLNLVPVNMEYVTHGRMIQLNGFYVIDSGGG